MHDVELFINLEEYSGYLERGQHSVFRGRLVEGGEVLTMVFVDPAKGWVNVDLNAEELEMDTQRVDANVLTFRVNLINDRGRLMRFKA